MLIAVSDNLLYIKRAKFFEKENILLVEEIFGQRRQREMEKEKQGETKYSSGKKRRLEKGKEESILENEKLLQKD